MPVGPEDVLEFWFGAPTTDPGELMMKVRRWFQGGADFDQEVVARFGPTVEAALEGELDDWANTARGRLALVIVLDQFTRNVFRGDPRTHEGDARARALTLRALADGQDRELELMEKIFLSMPLLHSEDIEHHEELARVSQRLWAEVPPLYAQMAEMHREQTAKYRDIIHRFGRFPHRNALLGRSSTEEEVAFLADWAEKMSPRAIRNSTD